MFQSKMKLAEKAKKILHREEEEIPAEKLMYGTLILEIHSARNLPNTDVNMRMFSRTKDLTDPCKFSSLRLSQN